MKVTISPEMDPPDVGVEIMGSLNSTTTVADVDGQGMEDPSSDERMFSNTSARMCVRQSYGMGWRAGGCGP